MNNFDLQKELRDQSPDDWQFGATSSPCIAEIPEKEREDFLPKGEVQRGVEDYMDCATRSALAELEAKLQWLMVKHKLTPENHAWLVDNGYLEGSRVSLSNRFTAINSGTTRAGNSLKAPLDSIHRDGVIPNKILPKDDSMTWDMYHDPKAITPQMVYLGQQFLARINVNYERVQESDFATLLKKDMVGVAGYAWPNPKNGVYPKTNGQANHAFMLYRTPKYYAYDSYLDEGKEDDYIKKLAPDYDFYQYGYRLFLSENKTPKDIQKDVLKDIAINLIKALLDVLKKMVGAIMGK